MQTNHSIVEMFDEACEKYASLSAFSCLGKTISYAELDRLSRQFATYLQHHTTLSPGDRLAVQLPNLLQYPVVLFGALRAGVVIVNTNPLYTGKELQHQLKNSGAKAIVVFANVAKALEVVIDQTDVQQIMMTEVADLHDFPKRQLINGALKYVKKQVPSCHFPSVVSFRKALELGKRDDFTPVALQLDDWAFLQYTGGTTGVAKGAMLTHANLVANRNQILTHWDGLLTPAEEVFAAPLPLYHIYAFTLHCMVLASIGAHNVLVPNPRDLPSLVAVFKDYPLTGFVGLNTLFVALLNNEEFCQLDFSRLELVPSGGMALTEDAAKRWQKVTGVLPCEGYGLTETSPVVAVNRPETNQLGTIGHVVPETEIKIIDSQGNSLSAGEEGELCIRGPQVMQGYWQDTEATDEVLDDEGWFKTGDMALVQDDGFIRIVDRKKDMIIVSGFNVYPNEVENVLVQHPEVVEAAVVAVPDSSSGEAVKAFLVLKEGSDLDDDRLKEFCRESLTAYKVPRFYEYRSELPKTNVGKVLRRELRS